MDPVTAIGFIASLDQLASVSANIVSNMYRYYRAVMDAPKRSEELRQEIGAVSDILNMIVMVVSSSSAASTFTVPTSFHASVTEMQATLAEMDKLVRPSATRGVKRLKWPFTKDENERLLSKLGRYKDILSATMEIKTAHAVTEVLGDARLKKRADILRWLCADDFTARHDEVRATRAKNSGIWFLNSKEFTEWANGAGPGCLFCSGIRPNPLKFDLIRTAGAGKSVLMSIAIDHLVENYATENAQIVYFYFDYKAQTIQTGVYVVGTLLKQLLCQSNHIPADLESFYNNSIANHKKPSLENLMRFVGPLSRPRVYAVFDALDECSDAYQRDVFSLFAHLEKSGVRLLISSRPHVRITRGQLESVKNLVVSADESDLENFVLRTLKTKRNNNPELEKKCLQLAKGAEGMFLLAKFQLDHVLSQMNPRQRIKALETVPRTLSAAYNEIITRIEASGNAGDAMQIMSWLMYAQEPLTMNALLEALVTEEGDIELQRDYMLNPTDVVECCKSLVVHDTSSDIVRFTHYTVQEFIVTLKSHLLDGGTLAKTCLDYLALDVFKAPIGASWNCESYFYDRVQRYKFSLYAARHWGVHAAGDPENSADVQRAIIRVLQSQQKRNAVAQLASRDCRFYSQNQTLLHFVAHYGHATICSLLLRKRLLPDTYMCSADNDVAMPSLEDDISRMDEDMRTPLHYAALKGHTQVVRILLSGGASIHAQDAYGWTALHAAANNGHADVVKVLVQADADPTIPDKKGQTPLHLSASNGHANATLSLLQGQGDVEARNLDGRTALHLAVGIGDIEVVKILLEWNSDVLAKDFDKRTPLHHAARYGRFEVIKWLLTYSRNFTNYIQDQDKDDRTALHHAAWNCDVEVVRLLLDANPNVIEVCDVYGRTALHQAAANGGLKVVKMLVNGNIDATDWRGRTALILAAERGDVAVVEALLEANADPTISDVEALTPLECAAIGGHNEIIKALAAVKVDSWALQGSQRVLQWTVESGHVETVKLLLDLLADAIGTESRDSALEIARWNEFEEIVTLLENAQLPGAPPSRFATKTGELAMSNDRKLTIHTPSRVDHDGRFHSMEIYPGFRCPPRCSREILFASPYPAPPSLVVGLNEIATSRRDNIRIKTYADEVHCDRFRIHIDSWARSKFFSAGSTWFTVGEGDQEYQYGSFNTLEDHPWDEPQIRTSRSIRFVRPYDVAPVVVVWLNSLDLYRQNEWRLRASASDISSTGFTLHIDSFGDTILFGAGASWIAYPIGKAGVASGTCRTDSKLPPRTNEQEATGYDGEAKFMTNFNTIPRVFVAFNMLSVSWREFLKVNVAIESINEVGMIWRINAWDGTRLDAAEASYIAIG